jgi:hypothetical protein
MKKAISILLVLILLSACGGAPTETQEPAPLGTPADQATASCKTPTNWAVQFNRSGGIAGFNEALTLQSDGNLKIKSENPPTNVERTISPDQISGIANLRDQACPFEMSPNDAGCADCFLYKLNIQMDGQTYVLLATDITMRDDVRPLIEALSQLLQNSGG